MPPPSSPTTGASTSGSPPGSNAIYTGPLITYIGDPSVIGGAFIDRHEPIVGKSDFGLDTLTRLVKGIAPYCLSYAATLVQGAQFSVNNVTYYLQSWEPDDDPVFPGFVLHYKGLIGGIPAPKADGQSVELSVTVAGSDISVQNDAHGTPKAGYQTARREIRYVSRSTRTRYITNSRPGTPMYGVDMSTPPYSLSSVITAVEYQEPTYPKDAQGNEDYNNPTINTINRIFSGGGAPGALVAALTPAQTVQAFVECTPVVGSPYFECTDAATLLLVGG